MAYKFHRFFNRRFQGQNILMPHPNPLPNPSNPPNYILLMKVMMREIKAYQLKKYLDETKQYLEDVKINRKKSYV